MGSTFEGILHRQGFLGPLAILGDHVTHGGCLKRSPSFRWRVVSFVPAASNDEMARKPENEVRHVHLILEGKQFTAMSGAGAFRGSSNDPKT